MARIWQLNASYAGITAKGTINGFPVFTADTAGSGESGFATAPLNSCLVGPGNVLRIEVTAKGDDARLNCSVEDAQTGDVIDTGHAAEIELPEGDPPHVIEIGFDAELDGFRHLLDRARPSDAEAMTAFALRLRDALNRGDTETVKEWFRPKFESVARDFGYPVEMVMEQAGGMVDAFGGKGFTFEAADVDAEPCCNGRLWNLKHRDGKALIRVEEGDETMSLDVCAAALPEGIAIVL